MSKNTSEIYNQVMFHSFKSKLTALRDSIESETNEFTADLGTVYYKDVCGPNTSHYAYVLDECENIIINMLQEIIVALLKAYNIQVKEIPAEWENGRIYNLKSGTQKKAFINRQEKGRDLIFIATESGKEYLYFFSKYGINSINIELEKYLHTKYKYVSCKYIVLVEKNAFSAQINHNENAADPSRGTKYYSLEYFFDAFFSHEEYLLFQKAYAEFLSAIRSYFGIQVVKSLNSNATYAFKDTIINTLKTFPYLEQINLFQTSSSIDSQQEKELNAQFGDKEMYRLLIGSTDYAKCFMTSEWLYHSLNQEQGYVDLTIIAMGYFKAVEQYLYSFLSLHTSEKDGKRRTIRQKNTEFNDNYCKNKKADITLGDMTGFLRYEGNKDLLRPEINSNTYTVIKQVLLELKDLRNGYLHKDNIDEWKLVEESRNKAYLFFYLMLGAYNFDNNEVRQLGLTLKSDKSDYYRLCEYLNLRISKDFSDPLRFPILYLNEKCDPYDFMVIKPDPQLKYNSDGTPEFSGIYFSRIGKNQTLFMIDANHLPSTPICIGTLAIGRKEISITPSGPQKTIFKDGKFIE